MTESLAEMLFYLIPSVIIYLAEECYDNHNICKIGEISMIIFLSKMWLAAKQA